MSECLRTSSISVIVNGCPIDEFIMGSGLR